MSNVTEHLLTDVDAVGLDDVGDDLSFPLKVLRIGGGGGGGWQGGGGGRVYFPVLLFVDVIALF